MFFTGELGKKIVNGGYAAPQDLPRLSRFSGIRIQGSLNASLIHVAIQKSLPQRIVIPGRRSHDPVGQIEIRQSFRRSQKIRAVCL